MMEALACHPLGSSTHGAYQPGMLLRFFQIRSKFACNCRDVHERRGHVLPSLIYVQTRSADTLHPQAKRRGFWTTGKEIVKRETPLGLYKGLGAVVTGIVPKMAIRFTSYEWYKQLLADKSSGAVSGQATFIGMSLRCRILAATLPLILSSSWSCGRGNGGCCSRDPYGSGQDTFASPTPLHG